MKTLFRIILALIMVQLTVEATAQFKKPLSKPKKQSDEAMINIGIVAGPSITHWQHFNVAQAEEWFLMNYTPKLKLGYTGGLFFEAILGKHLSVGINALYTQHNVHLEYINEKFPIGWDNGITYSKRTYDLVANYQSVALSLPLTYYFFTVKEPVRPYLYVAPRVSYIINGTVTETITDATSGADPVKNSETEQPLCPSNHISLNVGATAGLGFQFRISMAYYYFLIKTEAYANWNFLNTFSEAQLNNEFNNKRQDADAAATITFVFPLKKSLKDACHIMR